jgi:hypothetical protein
MGVTGVFYYRDDQGRAACTIPVTIVSPEFDMGDYSRLEVTTSLGQALFLEISPNAKAIMKSRRDKYTRIVPASMTFVEVGKCVRLEDDPDTVSKFAAEALKDRNYVHVSTTDGMKFRFAGTHCDSLAGAESGVTRPMAKFHLVSMGLSTQHAEDALKRATKNGRYSVANLKPLTTMHQKEASARADIVRPLLQNLPKLKMDLIKEAAFFDDPDTVDAVLSLNFINPENIGMFVEMLPDLRQTSSDLAQLLVASRLGTSAIPEQSAERAMHSLEEVIEGLENLQGVSN